MDMTDPEAIDDAYARHCKDVKRYLAFDVALLAMLGADYDSSRVADNSLVDKKKRLLIGYQELRDVETTIPLFGTEVLMAAFFTSSILLGAVLNLPLDLSYPQLLWISWYFVLLFTFRGLSGVFDLRAKMYSIFGEEEDTPVQGNVLNESSGGTAGVSSSTAVELTELDTRRRTATGLLEEGRQGAGS